MVTWLRPRRSAISFDVGAAGVRAYQLRLRGQRATLCDALQLERDAALVAAATPPETAPAANTSAAPPAVETDPAQLGRLIGQAHFEGREICLVLSPPDVQFFPMRLPEQALSQAPERVEQALRWEVAQDSRHSADNLEVRYWKLPHARGQQANVMAVVMPTELALRWYDQLHEQGLTLRRIDVSPCALVRLARCVWTPAAGDVWGVLDLGLRHATLTVVVGTVPTYVRSLSVSPCQWTQKLVDAFEVSFATAEQLKRQQVVELSDRGVRGTPAGRNLVDVADLAGAFSGVLRDSLRTLALEVGRCLSYVLQSFPDAGAKRLFLAGGGAGLGGLTAVLENELGISVNTLAAGDTPGAPQWERPLSGVRAEPRGAAALGAALLDLEVP